MQAFPIIHLQLFKVEIPQYKHKDLKDESEKFDCSIWKARYAAHQKLQSNLFFPSIVGVDMRFYITGDDNCNVYFFKNIDQLNQKCGGILKGHSSLVYRLEVAKSQAFFYSMGLNDNTIIEWKGNTQYKSITILTLLKVDFLIEEEQENVKMPNIKEYNGIKKQLLLEIKQYQFVQKENQGENFKDSLTFFRGTKDKQLNKLLQAWNNPKESKGEIDEVFKRPPPLSIQMDFIYGFECFQRRKTLFYVHNYDSSQQNKQINMKKGKGISPTDNLLPGYLKEQLVFSKKEKMKYPKTHQKCSRILVYFISRIAIIYNHQDNSQRFYQGHKNRITCMDVHPSKMIVCTGEASQSPELHVWSIESLEPLQVLTTQHTGGISQCTFSHDGNFIASVGMDSHFSIQITHWKNQDIYAFRSSSYNPILDLTFNPYDCNELATCGPFNVTIWKLEGRSLIRKDLTIIKEEEKNGPTIITTIAYINFHIGPKIQSDIICGDNFGGIGIVTCKRYFKLAEKTHGGEMINQILVTKAISNKLLMITSGEDETICIWDSSFNKISEFSIRNSCGYDNINSKEDNDENVSAQSIDLYSCQRQLDVNQKGNKTPDQPILLVGTRNGDILEAQLKATFSGLSQKHESDQDGSQQRSDNDGSEQYSMEKKKLKGDSIEADWTDLLHCHQSLAFKKTDKSMESKRKLFFAIHPRFDILFTVGDDKYLKIWNTETNKWRKQRYLGWIPTAIAIHPITGNILMIGYQNGYIQQYDSSIHKNKAGNAPGIDHEIPKFTEGKNIMRNINTSKTAVLSLIFSKKGDYLAASYAYEIIDHGKEEKKEQRPSYITIYTSKAKNNTGAAEDDTYQKYKDDIVYSAGLEQIQSGQGEQGTAVNHMSFSEDNKYIMICYQTVDRNQIRINNSLGKIQIYNLESGQWLKGWDVLKSSKWANYNFPNSIYTRFLRYKQNLSAQGGLKNQKHSVLSQDPTITSMFDLTDLGINALMLGSINGEIYLVRTEAVYTEPDYTKYNLNEMCQGKSYQGHVSYVNQIEAGPNMKYLYTTGIMDQCVIQWRITQEWKLWELDLLQYDRNTKDLYSEIMTADKFNNLYKEILPLREEIYEDVISNIEEFEEVAYDLTLKAVIGRRAFTRRNNLYYDYDGKIIYFASTQVIQLAVNLEDDGEEELEKSDNEIIEEEKNDSPQQKQGNVKVGTKILINQTFLTPDEKNLFTTFPEISAMAIDNDRKIIAVGTTQTSAKIILWEVCSRTMINTMNMPMIVTVLNLKFAHDSRHICCLGQTKDHTIMVFLIDTQLGVILGTIDLIYSVAFKIRDMCFMPNSIYSFVTCGLQHMTRWQYNGSTLQYYAMAIQNPKGMVDMSKAVEDFSENQKNDKKSEVSNIMELKVNFLCLTYVENLAITGGEDGILYVWGDDQILKKQPGHSFPNLSVPILSLASLPGSNEFVSGGMGGRIMVWRLDDENLELLYKYFLNKENKPQDLMEFPKFHVQSLCIGSQNILAGTRNGDIYELKRLKKYNQQYDNLVQKRMSCCDNEIPKVVGFSANKDRIFYLSDKGYFCVWKLRTLTLCYENHFNKVALNMVVCQKYPEVVLVFEHDIVILETDFDPFSSPGNLYKQKYQKNIKEREITEMKINQGENWMAISLSAQGNLSAQIDIYNLDNLRLNNKFPEPYQIGMLNSNIEFIDFSTDDCYMVYKDYSGEITYVDISDKDKIQPHINPASVEFTHEWLSDGLKISQNGIQHFYNGDNGIQKLALIGGKTLLVTDDMGTIRLFNYPIDQERGAYKCYSQHMNYVTQCVSSLDSRYLLTCSESDRCVYIWKINQHATKVQEEPKNLDK